MGIFKGEDDVFFEVIIILNKFVENSGSQSKNKVEKNSVIRNSSEVKIAGVEI